MIMKENLLLSIITKFPDLQLLDINDHSFEIHFLTNKFNNIDNLLKEINNQFNDDFKFSISLSKINLEFSNSSKKYNNLYTTGCFDIFHYGHLNILRKSKELCEKLIVGVSTDELILKEKGKLPVIPFEERFKVVSAIKYVDLVVPQINKNKQEAVDKYNIDAISVGDDWKGRYPKTSCPVEYFQYTPNVSSTILKDMLSLNKKT